MKDEQQEEIALTIGKVRVYVEGKEIKDLEELERALSKLKLNWRSKSEGEDDDE
jgi:hypothetical protein